MAGLQNPSCSTSRREISRIMGEFENIGGNCEFGIVQRYCGIEPLGLFRFTLTPIDNLVRCLEASLVDYGSAGDLELIEAANGYISCISRRYKFTYSTGEPVSCDRTKLMNRELRKIGYLKRRFLEDINLNNKILVRKVGLTDHLDSIHALIRSLEALGRTRLLLVREAKAGDVPGEVNRLNDHVMEGTIARFSPDECAIDVDLISWINLCQKAYRLYGGAVESEKKDVTSIYSVNSTRSHRIRYNDSGMSSFRVPLDGTKMSSDDIYVMSAWIWLPDKADISSIFAVIGYERLAWCAADMKQRNCWQQIWVSARVPSDHAQVQIGLVAHGKGGQRFWSTGWRFAEGIVPIVDPPPSTKMGAAFRPLLSRLKW